MSLFLINIVTFVYLCSTVHVYVYCLYKVAKLVSDHIVMFVDNKICLSKNIGFILLNLYSEYSRNTTGRYAAINQSNNTVIGVRLFPCCTIYTTQHMG